MFFGNREHSLKRKSKHLLIFLVEYLLFPSGLATASSQDTPACQRHFRPESLEQHGKPSLLLLLSQCLLEGGCLSQKLNPPLEYFEHVLY